MVLTTINENKCHKVTPAWRLGVVLLCLFAMKAETIAQVEALNQYPRRIIPGARNDAFAEMASAEAFDISNMYANPGALGFLLNRSVIASHRLSFDSLVFQDVIALPIFLGSVHSFGIGVNATHSGQIRVDANLKFTQYGLDIGYCWRVIPNLGLGIIGTVEYGRAEGVSQISTWGGIGVFYQPSSLLSYGFAFHGIGTINRYTYDPAGDRTLLSRNKKPPQRLELGSTLRIPSFRIRPITIMTIGAEYFPRERGFAYKGGLEIAPFQYLGFRIGVLSTTTQGASLRFGLSGTIGRLQIDGSVAPTRKAERFATISLSILLEEPRTRQ